MVPRKPKRRRRSKKQKTETNPQLLAAIEATVLPDNNRSDLKTLELIEPNSQLAVEDMIKARQTEATSALLQLEKLNCIKKILAKRKANEHQSISDGQPCSNSTNNRPRGKPVSSELRELVSNALLNKSMTIAEASATYGVHPSTVSRIKKEAIQNQRCPRKAEKQERAQTNYFRCEYYKIVRANSTQLDHYTEGTKKIYGGLL